MKRKERMKMKTGLSTDGKRKNFTLIELLIVVAIIAILMGILLPALNKARDKARAITCTNVLKNYGTASALYADYNNGLMVPVYLSTSGAPSGYQTWAHNRSFRTLLGEVRLQSANICVTAQHSYYNSTICPMAYKAMSAAKGTGDHSPYYSYGMTPEDCAALSSAWKKLSSTLSVPAYKIVQVRRPSERLAFADSQGFVVQNPGSTLAQTTRWMYKTDEKNAVFFRHNSRANILMVDGHVKSAKESEVYVGPAANKVLWKEFYKASVE